LDRIRVLVADDEAAVREALVDLVSSDDSMEVVGIAEDADRAIEIARAEKPDVALIDVKMPGGGGPRATREIRRESPQTHIVALSAYEDRHTVLDMLRAGVVGYISKGASSDDILHTIRRSMRGQSSLAVKVTADVIHELVTLLERSESLTRDLQEMNRSKSELIQVLSHELFTPITVIQGFALTVAERGSLLQPGEVRDLAHNVSKASARLRRLVGNLAAAARLDREEVEVPMRSITAGELLRRATAEFPLFASRLVLPPDPADLEHRLWADPDLAARAIVLVLENAFEFSQENEQVEVAVHERGGELEFAISDRGPGVPEGFRETMFEAFTQSDTGTTREHEGLGIGLYLARRIMRAHHGRIEMTPCTGGGSTFVLSFLGFEGSDVPQSVV
jgi:signal transduction histidine kinase